MTPTDDNGVEPGRHTCGEYYPGFPPPRCKACAGAPAPRPDVAYAIEYKSARPPIGSQFCILSQHIRFPTRAAAQAAADAITAAAGNPTRVVEMPVKPVAWWRR